MPGSKTHWFIGHQTHQWEVQLGRAVLLVAVSLSVGILGYHAIAGLGWVDAFLNAAMILGGMGPVDPLTGTGAKLFAGAYALFSGLVLVGVAGLLLAPVFHHVLREHGRERARLGSMRTGEVEGERLTEEP
ncbi:MAG: hypothetical protein IPK12_19540 [Gemmatimonadetes bacterium]|nr:hypothetical protein [Gemmatimonadota bacterium]